MLTNGDWFLDESQSYLLGLGRLAYTDGRACMFLPINFDYKEREWGGWGEG